MFLFSVIFPVIVPVIMNVYTKQVIRFFNAKYQVFLYYFYRESRTENLCTIGFNLTNIPMGNDKLELHVANHNTCLALTNTDKIFIGTVIVLT